MRLASHRGTQVGSLWIALWLCLQPGGNISLLQDWPIEASAVLAQHCNPHMAP